MRAGTYDRLLAAPMALVTLLIGKTLVGAFFAVAVSLISLLVGLVWLHVDVANLPMLITALILASLSFSALGLVFASIPSHSVGNIMMPSTLIRWPLLFISGIFIPLNEMSPWARAVAYLSPLTYAQELMNRAVLGKSLIAPWLSPAVLLLSGVVFLAAAGWMHRRSRRLGY